MKSWKVEKINRDKKQFLELLLLADEQESMIDRYLDRGDMYALYDGDLKGICVVTREAEGVCELKNLAVCEKYQGQGYGRILVEYICDVYKKECRYMYVGTGDSPLTVPFYEKCGFIQSHRVKDFFVEHYDHLVFEAGVQLRDMVYLKREL